MRKVAGLRAVSLITILWTAWPIAAKGMDRPELKLKTARFDVSNREISGIGLVSGQLHIVADSENDTYIYKVDTAEEEGRKVDPAESAGRFVLSPAIDLKKLKGYEAYRTSLQKHEWLKDKDKRLDLEGIAVCGDTVYLANERVREIVKVSHGTIERLPINFSNIEQWYDGGANAGIEGIAVDCEQEIMWVAKERDPRRLITVNLKSRKVTSAIDFPGSDRQGQKVVDPFTHGGLLLIGPDIADMHFFQGYLYALERNTFEIVKLDPKTLKPLARVSYHAAEANLYESGEPFGLAEALLITEDEILVGFDNNGSPLTHHAQKKHGITGIFGSLFTFERPKGF